MKNPVHPGELVKANLEELGLSVAAAAKALGVTRQQLYNVIGGKSAVTPDRSCLNASRRLMFSSHVHHLMAPVSDSSLDSVRDSHAAMVSSRSLACCSVTAFTRVRGRHP